jgi:hypothetical protein
MMKAMTSAAAIALMVSTLTASAVTINQPMAAPSAQNSGVGIAGLPGSKDGPAVRPGTVGSSARAEHYNLAVAEQDSANVPGSAGNKSGPPAQRVLRGGM